VGTTGAPREAATEIATAVDDREDPSAAAPRAAPPLELPRHDLARAYSSASEATQSHIASE